MSNPMIREAGGTNFDFAAQDEVVSKPSIVAKRAKRTALDPEVLSHWREMTGVEVSTNREARRQAAAQGRRQKDQVVPIRRSSQLVEVAPEAEFFHLAEQAKTQSSSFLATKSKTAARLTRNAFEFEQAGRWATIRAALAEWSNLGEGWDGEEAEPIEQLVLEAATTFVNAAERYSIEEPSPYINNDGEIGFIWELIEAASVSFLPSNRFLALCPRHGKTDLRVAGPLDIAVCSPSLFDALQELCFANVDHAQRG